MSDYEMYDDDSDGAEYVDHSSDEEEDESLVFDGDTYAIIESDLQKQEYSVLSAAGWEERRDEAVRKVAAVLDLPSDEAECVLRLFKWDENSVNEMWFCNEDEYRNKLGLDEEKHAIDPTTTVNCAVCFEAFKAGDMLSAECSHLFCKDCWHGYVKEAVSNGAACIDLRCPLPTCHALVPAAVFKAVCTADELRKYDDFRRMAFVDSNPRMSWCTAPGCDNVIELTMERPPSAPLDIVCSCANTFCFTCKEEAHRPVSCETVRKWITKNSAESESVKWVLANTKQCPKCRRPIEKNQGCMHMTCSQCKHEFCWLCLGSWQEHGEKTGGFYNCNKYQAAKEKGEYDEEQRRATRAKEALERYMHYFERYNAHHQAQKKALQEISQHHDKLEKISEVVRTPTSQLKFISDAYRQVTECRRVLKYTYAYGYYAFESEEGKPELSTAAQQNKEFFEFLQGDLLAALERLHGRLENQMTGVEHFTRLPTYECDVGSSTMEQDVQDIVLKEFSMFQQELMGMTDVTKKYFSRLVKQLERGLDAVVADLVAGTSSTSSVDAAAADVDTTTSTVMCVSSSSSSQKRRRGAHDVAVDAADCWQCDACTCVQGNTVEQMRCVACNAPRAQH